MIARLILGLPFAIVVPDRTPFEIVVYQDGDYTVTIHPPVRSDIPLRVDVPSDMHLDEKPAFIADALWIDFGKPVFDRKRGLDFDPPRAAIERAVEFFLTRLRYVAKAPQVIIPNLDKTNWRLEYLNDDQTPLPKAEGAARAYGARTIHVSLVNLSPELFKAIHELPLNWEPPVWYDLLVEAIGTTHKPGTAVVLAATGLEVFISDVLNGLAREGTIPSDIWDWLNDRDNWLKDPSTEEQFDALLRHFVGHSLKDVTGLWQDFMTLKTARNKFVHEGRPLANGRPVDDKEAARLVASAWSITAAIRPWLPGHLQWPAVDIPTQLRMTLPLFQ